MSIILGDVVMRMKQKGTELTIKELLALAVELENRAVKIREEVLERCAQCGLCLLTEPESCPRSAVFWN